jgi:class 3 adenylate cyclase
MAGRRHRGIFDGLPRAFYRRFGSRYLEACAVAIALNGVVVAGFGLIALALYVDLDAGELVLFGAGSALALALEGLVAALHLLRLGAPARSWLAGARGNEADERAWAATARLPFELLRRPSLYVLGAAGAVGSALLLAAVLHLPARDALLVLPLSVLLYVSAVILRHLAIEFMVRPLLEQIGEALTGTAPLDAARVSLHPRLVAAVPMANWGTGIIVAGLLTDNARDLETVGLAGIVAFAVSALLSIWLSLVLADAVTAPIVDLRDATRRVAAGDLDVRVPVVSTDETGELAASFNAMVAGLNERERLRDAFGAYVDPSLTDRILAEGADLRGEQVEVSVLFLDVRDFTTFAEAAPAHEVVAMLNALYEAVVPLIADHGGHANKFIGDGLLAVFGAPERHEDHARRAVDAAVAIARLVRERELMRVGIGVNTGLVVFGSIGGGGRRDFTVIGDAVNTAARVEAATRVTGDDVLITQMTLRALGEGPHGFEERPAAPLRGKAATVRLYAPAR